MAIDLLAVLQQAFPDLFRFITLGNTCLDTPELSLCDVPLIMTKEANPTFGLYIESRTGSLIIMSVLHSAQGEASISCHTVGAERTE